MCLIKSYAHHTSREISDGILKKKKKLSNDTSYDVVYSFRMVDWPKHLKCHLFPYRQGYLAASYTRHIVLRFSGSLSDWKQLN